MKIRKGFVSNSSSSSFVVFFEKEPQSIGEMHLEAAPCTDKQALSCAEILNTHDRPGNALACCVWYVLFEQADCQYALQLAQHPRPCEHKHSFFPALSCIGLIVRATVISKYDEIEVSLGSKICDFVKIID